MSTIPIAADEFSQSEYTTIDGHRIGYGMDVHAPTRRRNHDLRNQVDTLVESARYTGDKAQVACLMFDLGLSATTVARLLSF